MRPVDDFFRTTTGFITSKILSILPYPVTTSGQPSTIDEKPAGQESFWKAVVKIHRLQPGLGGQTILTGFGLIQRWILAPPEVKSQPVSGARSQRTGR